VVGINLNGTRPGVVDLGLTPPVFTVESSEPDGALGSALAAADYDGDMKNDLVIGAPLLSGTSTNAGAIYIIRDMTLLISEVVPADADVVITGGEDQERLGSSLHFARYDSATGMDILAGAPGTDLAAATNAGAVYIFSGGGFPDGTFDRREASFPTIRIQIGRENFALGTHLTAGQMDGLRREDVFFSGSGTNPFPSDCGTSNAADWQQCHAFRYGIGVYGGLSGSLPEAAVGLSARPGWMNLE